VAINIKNAETEELARELSRRRKRGITDVITEALRRELAREGHGRRRDDTDARLRRIGEIVRRHRARAASTSVLAGYNEHGLFD
jgi:hypothetical protein